MDTVTESRTAIAMAEAGGLGIIHRNLTPEEQKNEVARVKFRLNGLIEIPICVNENQTIEQILNMRTEKRFPFHTFPVLNNEGKLVGIITETDFDFCQNISLKAKDIMTREIITTPKDTPLKTAYKIMQERKKRSLPLTDKEGKIVGLYVLSDVKRIITGSSKNFNLDKRGQLRVGAAVGVYDDAFNRLEILAKLNIDVVVIDAAHADTKSVIETLKKIKEQYPTIDVVAGNISIRESAERLIKAGADGIKVGQGGGSICITSPIAGTGRPQVTAVYECSLACDKYEIPLCSDGGIIYSGDTTKAIGAGAWTVMMGNVLAGTEETPGETVFAEGRQWKHYRGMGSLEAMKQRGSRDRYHQSSENPLIAQGVEGLVPFKGPIKQVLTQYTGGLRIGMGSIGAKDIKELRENANFDRVTDTGNTEAHPHNVLITKEPPNYSLKGQR